MTTTLKHILLFFLLLTGSFSGAAETYYFTGKLWDSTNQVPVINHPLMIYSDDLSEFIITTTDELGNYYDSLILNQNIPVTVETTDCWGEEHYHHFDTLQQINSANFNICTSATSCQAFFYTETDTANYLKIHFKNISEGNYTYVFWDFGDGEISNDPNPVHLYQEEGLYVATLMVSNDSYDCYDILSLLIPVFPNDQCHTDFSYEWLNDSSEGYLCQFKDLTEGNPDQWHWDFGDGTVSFEQNPTHIYEQPGKYYVYFLTIDNQTNQQCYTYKIIQTPKETIFNGYVFDSLTSEPIPNFSIYLSINDSVKYQLTTNDSGYYHSETIMLEPSDIVKSFALDCHGDTILHFYPELLPVNRHDFYLCNYQEVCNAQFDFELDSLNLSPNIYHFSNLSDGDVAMTLWDFGDGTQSNETNPIHCYQEAGTYQVTLTVTSPYGQCSDTVTKVLSTPQYYDFGGQVFLDNFPINIEPGDSTNKAKVFLYRKYKGRWLLMDQKEFWELGYYWFTQKLAGHYLLRVDLTEGSQDYENYAPSYYINELTWDQANIFELQDTTYQESIWLTPLESMENGIGTISGYVSEESRDSLDLNNLLIELFNQAGKIVRYTFTDQEGSFNFSNLPYGKYALYPELPGYCGGIDDIEITETSPVISNSEVIIYDCQVTGTKPIAQQPSAFNIYPLPANDVLFISGKNDLKETFNISLFDALGKKVLNKKITLLNNGQKVSLRVSDIPNGLYILTIKQRNGVSTTKKIIINHHNRQP